jgi:hypothetical protein
MPSRSSSCAACSRCGASRPSRASTQPVPRQSAGLTDMDAIEAGWKARGLDIRFRR